MDTIIVTGANGFIGQYVVEQLLKDGFFIIGVDRNKDLIQRENYVSRAINICNKDEVESVFKAVSEITGIIHLAADIDMIGSERTIQTNCVGTYYLAQCAVANRLKYFINMSSIPVIGTPIELPITESHPVNPNTLYHITKFAGEKIVENLCADYMNVLNYRISSPIGVNMSPRNFLSILLDRCTKNETIEIYGQGLREQNYIDVRDIAQAILCGIRSNTNGLFLIAGKKEVSNIRLAELCKKITLSKSQIVLGNREDIEENNCWKISIEKAQRELQFLPQYSIEETISWIYSRMKEVQ